MSDDLAILFQHERFVAIEKPCMLLSVPGRSPEHHDSVLTRARVQFPHATGPIVMHRLDWETSGVMLLAMDAETHARLGRQFEKRAIRKAYIAVLSGPPVDPEGEIRLPLKPDWSRRPLQVVSQEHGREAITRYRVVGVEGGRARVEFMPVTGRTHQLRVHAAAGLGRPILGDGLYGDRTSAPRLMLHAWTIDLFEPVPGSRNRIRIESPAPF